MLFFACAYVLEGEIPLRAHTGVQMHSPNWVLPSISFNNELLMECRSTTDLSTRIKKAYETYLLGFEEVGGPPLRPSGIAALFDMFSCLPCLVASQQRKRKTCAAAAAAAVTLSPSAACKTICMSSCNGIKMAVKFINMQVPAVLAIMPALIANNFLL